MNEPSSFASPLSQHPTREELYLGGATCDTYIVRLNGKLLFKKKLKDKYKGQPQYVAAFQKEFEVGFRLEHPALPRYIQLTEEDNCPCLFEEYIDGDTLTRFVGRHSGYFTHRTHADTFINELLSAIEYLHEHQVLFLDLKPDNILITHVGHRLRLVDLGGCYSDMFDNTTERTPGFAAPEQMNGKTIDERTDIYLIGKILQYIRVPRIYSKVITCCLRPEPTERYSNVAKLRRAIVHTRRRIKAVRILMVGVAIACVLAATFALVSHRHTSAPSTPAIVDTVIASSS